MIHRLKSVAEARRQEATVLRIPCTAAAVCFLAAIGGLVAVGGFSSRGVDAFAIGAARLQVAAQAEGLAHARRR